MSLRAKRGNLKAWLGGFLGLLRRKLLAKTRRDDVALANKQ